MYTRVERVGPVWYGDLFLALSTYSTSILNIEAFILGFYIFIQN